MPTRRLPARLGVEEEKAGHAVGVEGRLTVCQGAGCMVNWAEGASANEERRDVRVDQSEGRRGRLQS